MENTTHNLEIRHCDTHELSDALQEIYHEFIIAVATVERGIDSQGGFNNPTNEVYLRMRAYIEKWKTILESRVT